MAAMDAGGGRRWAAAGLIVVACLLAVAAHVSLWFDRVVLDTPGFVAALAPLSDDDQVTDALAATSTDAVDAAVRAALDDPDGTGSGTGGFELPAQAAAAAEVVGGQVREWVQDAFESAFADDAFDPVWRDGVRRAHQDFLAALDDPDADLTVQVTDVVARADEDLEARGLDLFADETVDDLSRVTVLPADQLDGLRRVAAVVDRLGPWFPWAALVAAVAALALAPHRLRALAVGGVAVALSVGLVTWAEHRMAAREVSAAPAGDRPVARAAWDALAGPLDRQAAVIAGRGAGGGGRRVRGRPRRRPTPEGRVGAGWRRGRRPGARSTAGPSPSRCCPRSWR